MDKVAARGPELAFIVYPEGIKKKRILYKMLNKI